MRSIVDMKRCVFILLLGCGLGAIMCAVNPVRAEQAKSASAVSATHVKKPVATKRDSQQAKRIDDKLNQVLVNQQAVLQKFEAIKQELRIIKVRATSRGAIQ